MGSRQSAIEGGNFGRIATWLMGMHSALRRMLNKRVYALSWLSLDPLYVILSEFQSWMAAISLIPERIRHRKVLL